MLLMYEKLLYASQRLAIAMRSFRDGRGYCSHLLVINERRRENFRDSAAWAGATRTKKNIAGGLPCLSVSSYWLWFSGHSWTLASSFTWFGSSNSQPGKAMLRSSCSWEARFNLAQFWCEISAQSALQPLLSHRYTRKVTHVSPHTHTHHQPHCCCLMGVSKLNFLGSFLQSSQVYTSFTLRCLHQAVLSLIWFYLHYT